MTASEQSERAVGRSRTKRIGSQGLGVGLVGFGTIGTGVATVLGRNADVITARLGFPLRLVRIADLDTTRDRGVDLAGVVFDADANALIDDPNVQLVVELIGGTDAARRLILRALERGKPVVTANKALLALYGKEIFEVARRGGVDVAFEASVGGGIPILRSLREGFAANRIESVHGIINGTTNYVLTEMEKGGASFDAVLKRAQELGYAELDPSIDVDGIDAAHKITLLAAMAFGAELTFKEVPTEGIRDVTPLDLEAAQEFGYRVRLLGITKSRREAKGERIEVRVHPTMIPAESLLAKVDGAMNAIAVHGDAVGPTLFYGAGAGEMPTASAVVGDLVELAREVRRGSAGRVAPLSTLPEALVPKPIVPLGELFGRSYLRFTVQDRPGVLSAIAGVLGDARHLDRVGEPEGTRIRPPERSGGRARVGSDRRVHPSGLRGGGPQRARRDRPTAGSDGTDAADPHRGGVVSAKRAGAAAAKPSGSSRRKPQYRAWFESLHDAVRALWRWTRSSTPHATAGCCRSSTTWTSCARHRARTGSGCSKRARTATSGPTARASGARRSGCYRRSTTRTSCRCTKAIRTCSGRSATAARSASKISGSSSAATRIRAPSRISA